MAQISINPKKMQNGDSVTSYSNTVDENGETFTFLAPQETVHLRNKGIGKITYTVGASTGDLYPSESIVIRGNIESIHLSSDYRTQQFEVWAEELGGDFSSSEVADLSTSVDQKLAVINEQLASITQNGAVPSNVILFEDWEGGEPVTIDTSIIPIDPPPTGDTTAPVLTITPAGTFTDTQTVTMSTNETATIFYTLDDSDPKVSGTKLTYAAPLTLTETDTVKAYAKDTAGNDSAVQTVTYTKEVGTPAGTIIVSDTFNRADATTLGSTETGQPWSALSGVWGVSTNQAYLTAALSGAFATVDAGIANCEVQVTYGAFHNSMKLACRVSSINNCLVFNGDGTFSKIVNGTWTTLGTTTVPKAGDIIKIKLDGDTITVTVNGGTPLTVTETFNNTVTKHGLASSNTTPRFDDFKVVTI